MLNYENIIVEVIFAMINIIIGFCLGWHYCKLGFKNKKQNTQEVQNEKR